MEILGWRAYYPQGKTIDNTDTIPKELPDGLLGIVEFLEPPYRKIVDAGDWFWMEDGRWKASDTVWDGWVEKPTEDAIRGQALSDEEWEEVRQQMLNDKNWPE